VLKSLYDIVCIVMFTMVDFLRLYLISKAELIVR